MNQINQSDYYFKIIEQQRGSTMDNRDYMKKAVVVQSRENEEKENTRTSKMTN